MRRLGIIARHWGQFDLIDGSERWGGAGAAAVAAALELGGRLRQADRNSTARGRARRAHQQACWAASDATQGFVADYRPLPKPRQFKRRQPTTSEKMPRSTCSPGGGLRLLPVPAPTTRRGALHEQTGGHSGESIFVRSAIAILFSVSSCLFTGHSCRRHLGRVL
jgi:hypothetical protein